MYSMQCPGFNPQHHKKEIKQKTPLINPLNRYLLLGIVTHSCTPSYSGGRDQEDHSLRPSQTRRKTPISHAKWSVSAIQLCRRHKLEDHSPGWSGRKAQDPIWKSNIKHKILKVWLKWWAPAYPNITKRKKLFVYQSVFKTNILGKKFV
jgi:hypothetical protein